MKVIHQGEVWAVKRRLYRSSINNGTDELLLRRPGMIKVAAASECEKIK